MGNNLYERISRLRSKSGYRSINFEGALRTVNVIVTAIMYLVYILLLLELFKKKRWGDLVLLIGTTGSGFVLVTVLRRLIAAPRPFEVYRFTPMLGRHRPSLSFPSRHLYSAAVITVASVWVFGWQTVYFNGVITLLLTAVRVIGGVHFIRDVVAGAAIGALFGGIGFWIIPWLCQ